MVNHIIVEAKKDIFTNNGIKDIKIITKGKKYECYLEGKNYGYILDDKNGQYTLNITEYGPFSTHLYDLFKTIEEIREEKINEIINI